MLHVTVEKDTDTDMYLLICGTLEKITSLVAVGFLISRIKVLFWAFFIKHI